MSSLLVRSVIYLIAGLFFLALHIVVYAEEGVPVTVREVRQQQIFRQVTITGSVTSPSVANLSPMISGLVRELYVDEGDQVSSGDLLLKLDSELAEYSWQAALALQNQAIAALEDSRRRLREAQQLVLQRSIAKSDVDALVSEVAQDQAALEQAKADASYQQAVLNRHQIKAPFSGVINKKLADRGEWVSQGQGVFELVATEGLRLDFAVAEDYLTAITLDASVQFSVSALPGRNFSGKVQKIVPVADPGARTFLLRVVAAEKGLPLMPGMSAQAVLQIPDRADGGRSAEGLVVPRDAVLRYSDSRRVVWSVEQVDDVWVARENLVETGPTFDGLVEIREGLSVGARVVVLGNEGLQDNQRVRIVEAR